LSASIEATKCLKAWNPKGLIRALSHRLFVNLLRTRCGSLLEVYFIPGKFEYLATAGTGLEVAFEEHAVDALGKVVTLSVYERPSRATLPDNHREGGFSLQGPKEQTGKQAAQPGFA
jgi:hypothetical protein